MNTSFFWVVTLCRSERVRRFGDTQRLHLQCQRVNLPNRQVQNKRSGDVFGRNSVQISAVTSIILTEIYHGSPKSLQTNGGTVSLIDQDLFLPNPVQFISHHTIRLCKVLILKASLGNLQK
jgi:hypothetical protein